MKTPLLTLCLALWLMPFHGLHAQSPAPTTQETVNEKVAAQQKDKSLLDVYADGGMWMHPILLTSLIGVALTGFCIIMVRAGRVMPPQLLADLNSLMVNKQVSQAYQLCQSQNSPLASVMGSALVKANFDQPMYNKSAMESAAAEALYAEETKLGIWVNYLNVCAQIAPMLGLFGTVVGMIQAFNQLAAGKAEPSDLASGIGVAMITTAGGLVVAIPTMCLYFFFRGQLTGIMTDMQKQCSRLLDLFTGELNQDGTRPATGYTMQVPSVSSDR
ncbi:MAG: MotA/TolQ/ExbB proton channel family protein [Blastochloris sp.]|nr:MotA/TolQ/ExbB proton channel family protein [Blastochloris sp.]